ERRRTNRSPRSRPARARSRAPRDPARTLARVSRRPPSSLLPLRRPPRSPAAPLPPVLRDRVRAPRARVPKDRAPPVLRDREAAGPPAVTARTPRLLALPLSTSAPAPEAC